MTPEQITRNQAFIRDLRANPKQAVGGMRDTLGGRCCLCVALDTALQLGFEPPEPPEIYATLPPSELAAFYGWSSSNPTLVGPTTKGLTTAAAINDISTPHTVIADYFEQTFPEIKP